MTGPRERWWFAYNQGVTLRQALYARGIKREREEKSINEQRKGSRLWPYFLSGELYGTALCVMTAEWIIVSLSMILLLLLAFLLYSNYIYIHIVE